MATVQLEQLRKVYDRNVVAVHGATFTVEDGEFVVLVGPSGCGKSTLLRMIAGLETITSGSLYIDGEYVNDVPPKDRDIAMVFQNYALYPHMTVYQNMAFGLQLRKFPKHEIEQRVRRAADILGIQGILDRKPGQLSGGQRQRVAVGRAIVRNPRVFLFDEPLSNLDAKLRVQTRTEISKLHRQLGATMVYVTHDQVEAMTMGSRIVVLKEGHVQQIDTPLRLYDHPANRFVAGFIGSPAMNFIEGTIVRNGSLLFRAADGAIAVPLTEKQSQYLGDHVGKGVTLGIRPEHIYPAVDGSDSDSAVVEDTFTLDVVEPMGNEIILYASKQGSSVVARIKPQSLPEPGGPINLRFEVSKMHFFDATTEESLAPTDVRTPVL